jgi:hypothetical protein
MDKETKFTEFKKPTSNIDKIPPAAKYLDKYYAKDFLKDYFKAQKKINK